MVEPKNSDAKSGVKTLGIRLSDELHAQFALVAQLDGLSLTDAIRLAVEFYVKSKRSEEGFAERAASVLAEIEREAAARRAAIQGLFGTADSTSTDSGQSTSEVEGEPAPPATPDENTAPKATRSRRAGTGEQS